MPLKRGKSRKVMAHNYNKLIAEGYPPRQARAIMLRMAEDSDKKPKKRKRSSQ